MIRTGQIILAEPHSNKDLWATPDHIFKPMNKLFHFSLDPCCVEENKKCVLYYTPETNGLIQDWGGEHVFVNPPYSRGNIDLWVKKCSEESKRAKVIALLPVSTSADWFQKYILGNTIYWIDKRVRFVNAPYTAPFSSMVVHFNGINKNLTWNQKTIKDETDNKNKTS